MDEVRSANQYSGWLIVAVVVVVYFGLYALNLATPLDFLGIYCFSRESRIWFWITGASAIGAFLVLLFEWKEIRIKTVLTGALLFFVSGLSTYCLYPEYSYWVPCLNSATVFLTFQAGVILLKDSKEMRINVFGRDFKTYLKSISLGIIFGIPLAAVNDLSLIISGGVPKFQNVFLTALQALSPGISEEIIFRFFIIAVCVKALHNTRNKKLLMFVAYFLGVVPHALLHVPDAFVVNPVSAMLNLIGLSVVFGLPMAYMQFKKGLESAIALHWFIDFTRFLLGF